MRSLEEIRKEIDRIDRQIAELFEQRMKQSAAVAEYKQSKGLSIVDSSREDEIISRNSALVSDKDIRDRYVLFQKEIMALSRDYQRSLLSGLRVAYSGVPGAFAYIAASRLYPGAELISYPDFEKAYNACSNGECDAVVLPFENSFAGEVSSVTDLMFSGDLYVNKVIEVEASQNLVACPGASLDTIKTVYSHPQALSQCDPYIKKHGFKPCQFANTAGAAKMVAEMNDPSVAAIASEEAAALYGLTVIEPRINVSSTNTTRFASLNRSLNLIKDKRKMGKHFILMFTVKNEAGSLAKMLNIIGTHNYNMYNLHSRPMKTLMWNYYFVVELDGDIATEDGSQMLRELASLCDRLKLVGSFYTR